MKNMRNIVVYVLLGWSQLLLCVDGARKEQMPASRGTTTTALRQPTKVVLTQVHMNAEHDGHNDMPAKISLWQDPVIPVHSVNAMATTVPGHRPRAFVVAGILIALMVMLLAAIFATIHRKVSEEVAVPLHPQGGAFRGLLDGTAPGAVVVLTAPNLVKKDVKTLRADAPGDLRRVEDEIAELTKDLTPPSSPEASQPEPSAEPEPSIQSVVTSERCVESKIVESSDPVSPPVTPAKAKFSEAAHLHPALGEAPSPTPPPRSPPKGNRRKRCKSDDAAEAAAAPKIEAVAAPVVPASDLRSLDDEFAELTRDLFTQSSPSSPIPESLCNLNSQGTSFSAKDFAEVKTRSAARDQGELRSHHDEVGDLIQDLMASSNRSSPLGELRSFQDEISELADDLHGQEP